MESLDNKEPLSAGEQKINEYVNRIKGGESKDSILQGLPESFKSGIEKGLAEPVEEETEEIVNEIPPQYRGLDSETLDFIWIIPRYTDQMKTNSEEYIKALAIEGLRREEAFKNAKGEKRIAEQTEIQTLREDLGISSRATSTESNVENSDFISMSQEDFATYLQNNISTTLKERETFKTDNAPSGKVWLANSLYAILTARTELRQQALDNFTGKSQETENAGEEKWRPYLDKIKSIKNQFNNTEYSGAWLQFNFGETRNTEKDGKRRKGYITISQQAVEDYAGKVESIIPEINAALKEAGYNGSFKISNNLKQLTSQFDSIVVHGANFDEVTKALNVIKKTLIENGVDVEGEQRGVDDKGILDPNEKASHTQLLAEKNSRWNPYQGESSLVCGKFDYSNVFC